MLHFTKTQEAVDSISDGNFRFCLQNDGQLNLYKFVWASSKEGKFNSKNASCSLGTIICLGCFYVGAETGNDYSKMKSAFGPCSLEVDQYKFDIEFKIECERLDYNFHIDDVNYVQDRPSLRIYPDPIDFDDISTKSQLNDKIQSRIIQYIKEGLVLRKTDDHSFEHERRYLIWKKNIFNSTSCNYDTFHFSKGIFTSRIVNVNGLWKYK